MQPLSSPTARGLGNYHAGLSAEAIVARSYQDSGREVACQRWRGKGGEIDLIVREDDRVVFTEVKKSRTHAIAATRLSRKQMQRMCNAASEFVAGEPKGQLTEIRFDLATVDQAGTVQIIENVTMHA